ncbi:MAG: 4-(cytidine 5'-diphospho)-2-C-methyl-D-erythritol kinase [Lachnospiraceae bacterium]|nr:4-(cytidine 5'-diphospho)-2-C-methyl-D-erythritol kinase [Lachnospiraceae bacterium]
MQINAYAKINLGLDITGRRPDGYHDLNTIMQTIDLHDVITMKAIPEVNGSAEEGSIVITCSDSSVPSDERNLACKAARLLFREFSITDNLEIDIIKNIPVAAGLGGGSADAAAVLKGVNECFGLDLSDEELMERGAGIGADIPFLIKGGTASAKGIGEIIEPLCAPCGLSAIVAVPDIRVSTKEVYEEYDRKVFSGIHPDIEHLKAAIEMDDTGCIPEFLGNVLESVTIPRYPVIEQIKEIMMNNGAAGALMSGSGPSVFGLFVDDASVERAFNSLEESKITDKVFLAGLYNG